jgi:hypothetical protein
MKKLRRFNTFWIIGCLGLPLAACGHETAEAPPPCVLEGADGGPMTLADGGHIHPDSPVPTEYRVLKSPYGYDDPGLATLGWGLYVADCARCHGLDGHGHGPDAAGICPPPVDLNQANRLHDDPYLYWRIHDGGTRSEFLTAMPGYGDTLGDDGIWRVITTIRWRFIDF